MFDLTGKKALVTGATGGQCFRSDFGIVMGGDEDDGGAVVDRGKPLIEFQTGNAAHLDVEKQAVEAGALAVLKEGFTGGVGHRLVSGDTQQAGKGSTDAFFVVDHGHVSVALFVHRS